MHPETSGSTDKNLIWYIYTLHDPREPGVVRYVGWTCDLKKRFKGHLVLAKNGRDKTYCGNWKRSLLRDGILPVMQVIESGVGPGWDEAEKKWIAHFRSVHGAKLTNLANGGGGVLGHRWVLSEETKKKLGDLRKGRRHTEESKLRQSLIKRGKKATPETKAKMSLARTGKKRSPEFCAKITEINLKRRHSEETKAKLREVHQNLARPVRTVPRRSAESRARTSAALKAHYAEHGTRKHSEESKAKTSSKIKAYRASRKI